MPIARIIVTPKKSVLDPQGEAVRRAIEAQGLVGVSSARVGKFIELEVAQDDAETRRCLESICHELLSNPVVEDYSLRIEAK
ncbi:MAG: phosphoribosylformylglycinamidine synthase subunit PurS [Verrucomicrobium sp.]|nr:phosphoribosylformylglycinamidine synthase subunit PurS [Verrucomicrobium sp.]